MTATTLLTTTDIARIVAVHGLPAVLSRMVDYLEADYRRWQAFEKTGQYRFTPPIHVIVAFHQALEDKPRLKVRPPRLGGNQSIGVFASRATHRPNGIGQSVVKLERVEPGRLWLSGIDLLDGTPVLDIKPYVPYADQVQALLRPCPEAALAAYPVSKAVGNVRNEGAGLIQLLA